MSTTQDVQKALGPMFPGSVWNPDPPKSTQLWCQPGLSGLLPSMPPSRVTMGVTGHHTAASHHKPSLLPPALRPLPPGSGPSPAGHPGQAPRPMADPPAPKASSDGVGLRSALTVPRALTDPCAGFLLPRGKKESIPPDPGVCRWRTGLHRARCWALPAADISQGSRE